MEIGPSELQTATQQATLLDKKFTILETKMKSQKEKEVRAAFKLEKNRIEKQENKAYKFNRAISSIGLQQE